MAGACYEIRDYENMLAIMDRLDRQIARGDTSYFGVDLTVYSGILRGYAFLDQIEYDKAIKVCHQRHMRF
jgi:hypothetical protein